MTIHLIVGTAGHIDHGKTALIRALTGVNTDRLPEEKRRGMTIELGFAALDLADFRLGIVDVPGHERLVRNMLAGAMAIDVAMLVIAASESIKPQTREHLEIMKHAGIEQGVIVLTKCDLVDAAWIKLVEDEVRELVAGSFLSDAPLVRVSATQGSGLATLRTALLQVARQAADSPRQARVDAPFCLGVDRAFSVAGHGTVVTGSVASGRLRVGDEVMIAPAAATARVRGLESHGQAVESVERGQRAAINLAGVPLQSIHRGDVIAQHGLLAASQCLAASLSLDAVSRVPRRRSLPVRIYVGTAEVHARLRWLQQPQSEGAMLAELCTDQPVACLAGQPLVIRNSAGSLTLGGGRVLDPQLRPGVRWTAADLQQLRQLASRDPLRRVAAALYLSGTAGFDLANITRCAGASPPPQSLLPALIDSELAHRLDLGGDRVHVLHDAVLSDLMQRVEQLLEKRHQQHPLRAAFEPSVLQKIFASAAAPGLMDAVVQRMLKAGRLVAMPAGLALPGYTPQLTKAQQREYARIIGQHRDAGFAPPGIEELTAAAQSHRDAVPKLVELAVAQGHLVRICAQWCLHRETQQQMLQRLSAAYPSQSFAVSDLRELLHTSRKYLVPLCEYLDRIGFTQREGNLRHLVSSDCGHPQECRS